METTRKNIELGVLIGLICAIVLSMCSFESACAELKSNVLRLHIIANSDSQFDQETKLKVRDSILKSSAELFGECDELSSAIKKAESEISDIEEVAGNTLSLCGAGYTASASVEECYFDTREYPDFTLPAGTYTSVVVRLGKAEGKNWWCVVFPAVCLPAAGGELSQTVDKNGTEIAENPQKYTMKFKAVEWYEEIKQKLKN